MAVAETGVSRRIPVGGEELVAECEDKDGGSHRPGQQGWQWEPPGCLVSACPVAASPANDRRYTQHDQSGKDREWLEWDVHVVHRQAGDADKTGRQTGRHREALPCPPSRREKRRQSKSREQGGDHHPGNRVREVVQWQAGWAQRPLSVATANNVRAMISRSSATD